MFALVDKTRLACISNLNRTLLGPNGSIFVVNARDVKLIAIAEELLPLLLLHDEMHNAAVLLN
jgi:hypothetical protein